MLSIHHFSVCTMQKQMLEVIKNGGKTWEQGSVTTVLNLKDAKETQHSIFKAGLRKKSLLQEGPFDPQSSSLTKSPPAGNIRSYCIIHM